MVILAFLSDVVNEPLKFRRMVTDFERSHPRQIEHVGVVEGVVRLLRAGNAGVVLFLVIHQAQVQYAHSVELQRGANHQGALLGGSEVVVAVGVEAQGQRVILDQPGALRQVEHA